MNYKTTNMGQAQNKNNKSNQQCVMGRSMFRILVAVILLASAMPAAAQVRLGFKAGLTVSEMRFDRDVANRDNRMGYTGGLVLDFNVPVSGLGVELGAMYSHRNSCLADGDQVYKRHYIDLPVHVSYRLEVPGAAKLLVPYAFTGPNFSLLFKQDEASNMDNSKTSISWDLGAGVELFRHLRVSASYGIGLTKSVEMVNEDATKSGSKDNCWTISATYLF